jgi:hypothetical protein
LISQSPSDVPDHEVAGIRDSPASREKSVIENGDWVEQNRTNSAKSKDAKPILATFEMLLASLGFSLGF